MKSRDPRNAKRHTGEPVTLFLHMALAGLLRHCLDQFTMTFCFKNIDYVILSFATGYHHKYIYWKQYVQWNKKRTDV